ncbi:MAG: site-specific integrase [Jatrophihabitantaceae bacterium]
MSKAREHVTAHRADQERGTLLVPDRQTFSDYANTAWLPRKQSSPKVREKTLRGYRGAVRHAERAFGNKPLGKVVRSDIEKMANTLVDEGKAQSTLALILFVTRSVFDDAIEDGLINRNPAKNVQAAGRKARRRSVLTVEQLRDLRSHLANDRLCACWLLTLSGLRRSEVMGLRWTDIDLRARTLTIRRGRVLVDGKRTVEDRPKTERGSRTLPLPADLWRALSQLRDEQSTAFGTEQAVTGLIAIDEACRPMRPERWSDLWRAHCRAAGVPELTLHAARHSSVTAMRDAGVPDHVVAAWHGHDEYIMRKVYSHAQADRLAAAGNALEQLFRGSF